MKLIMQFHPLAAYFEVKVTSSVAFFKHVNTFFLWNDEQNFTLI